MKTVSIIIPCYNQGIYLDECIESVKNQTYKNIEIIIVNDGSNDSYTLEVLDRIKNQYGDIKIINTKNFGLSAARNTGITNSTGYYILPLDGDDKIEKTYIQKCVDVFNSQKDVDIVYCIARFFGTKKGIFGLRDFSIKNMLNNNCVFCTAMYRRIDYNKTLGYSEKMIYGFEDWEFWLQMIEKDKRFYRINEVLFYYRRKDVSMITKLSMQQEKIDKMRIQIYENHKELYEKYNININRKKLKIESYISKFITLSQKIKLWNLDKKSKKVS